MRDDPVTYLKHGWIKRRNEGNLVDGGWIRTHGQRIQSRMCYHRAMKEQPTDCLKFHPFKEKSCDCEQNVILHFLHPYILEMNRDLGYLPRSENKVFDDKEIFREQCKFILQRKCSYVKLSMLVKARYLLLFQKF